MLIPRSNRRIKDRVAGSLPFKSLEMDVTITDLLNVCLQRPELRASTIVLERKFRFFVISKPGIQSSTSVKHLPAPHCGGQTD